VATTGHDIETAIRGAASWVRRPGASKVPAMRSRHVLAAAVLCASATAAADGLDGERFTPATGAEGGFVNEHPAVPFHLGWGLGLFLNFAHDSVVEVDANNRVIGKPVETALTADLVASLGLFGRLELGLALPVHLIYDGDPYGALAANAGAGDLRFVPKIALVRRGTLERHFLLGLSVPVSLPTGDDNALRGAGGVTVGPQLLLAGHLGKLGLGMDVGYRWRSQHPAGLAWGDGVTFGPWLSYSITEKLALRAEAFAEKMVGADVSAADFPIELLGGVEYRIGPVALYAAASFGLSDGIGDPAFRLIGGVRYRKDAPAHQGFEDTDHDGVLDKDDKAPYEPEDIDGYRDDDGVPDPDNDGDGIPDGDDECPELKGEADHRGCPAKTYVKIENGQIFIIGKVQFQSGSTEIDRNSEPLLDQIAQALDANPQVKKIRIEGHTDNVGGTAINQKLSEQRAASVRNALIKRKVDGDRLDARGYGETRPIGPNESPGGRQKNRRVEFVIVETAK
jgi:outer membrane protein OmpA-like peptidoglycan-associated protein